MAAERVVTLLVNPRAGAGGARRHAGVVERVLRSAGASIEVRPTFSVAEARAQAAAAVARAQAEPDVQHVVAVAGGDGSVHTLLQQVGDSGVPIGIVPAGSGDDAARAWGLGRGEPHRVAEYLMHAPITEVDLGRAEASDGRVTWFATVLAAGFDARVSERALDLGRVPPAVRYLVGVIGELRTFAPISYRLLLDGVPLEADAMLVAVANTPSYGSGMLVCPNADPADGLLDVLVLHPLPTGAFLRVFPRVYRGSHLSHPAVEVRRVQQVTVDAADVLAFADGEPVARLPLQVSVAARALRVVTPGLPTPRAAR
jgi:diacylglycerol kinase (ATP)